MMVTHRWVTLYGAAGHAVFMISMLNFTVGVLFILGVLDCRIFLMHQISGLLATCSSYRGGRPQTCSSRCSTAERRISTALCLKCISSTAAATTDGA